MPIFSHQNENNKGPEFKGTGNWSAKGTECPVKGTPHSMRDSNGVTRTVGPHAPMKSWRNFSGPQPELVFGKKLRPTFSFEGKLNCLEKKQKNLTKYYFH